MIKYIYAKRDKKLKFFENPTFSDKEPDIYKTCIVRSLGYCDNKKELTILNDCELICLGTFDDVSGVFKLDNTKLFDFSDFITL